MCVNPPKLNLNKIIDLSFNITASLLLFIRYSCYVGDYRYFDVK